MANETMINPETSNNQTVLNTHISEDTSYTVLNTAIEHESFISNGDILCGKYIVQDKLNVPSGEADLYVCTYGRGKYVAKVYRRKVAIKAEVTEALAGVYSPYIAQIFDLGEYNGYPVEILPYYQNGSVQGRQFSFEQLRQNIIPALNEGLKVLHDNGIIHKDLKPSNIMLNADGRTVSIIDFGISSIREEGSTVVVTKTGMTPDYSAPETFRGLFLGESDYYSLGITIYELYTGHTPYAQLQGEELERILSIQKIPLPNDMPEELKGLITALTYSDITNRRDKTNPNRRWTYEEVSNWCNGVKQPIPGISAEYSIETGDRIRPYRFWGKTYTSCKDLVQAFNENWDEGKKQLFRGLLSAYYKQFDPEIAGKCMDAEDAAERGDTDVLFFSILYDMDTELKDFIWKGQRYRDLTEIGVTLLNCLRRNDNSMNTFVDEVLQKKILSTYYSIQHNGKTDEYSFTLQSYESKRKSFSTNSREKEIDNYQLAFTLSGQRELVVGDKSFANVDQLTEHLISLINFSFNSFEDFCGNLIDDNNILSTQFESWLTVIGEADGVKTWRIAHQ